VPPRRTSARLFIRRVCHAFRRRHASSVARAHSRRIAAALPRVRQRVRRESGRCGVDKSAWEVAGTKNASRKFMSLRRRKGVNRRYAASVYVPPPHRSDAESDIFSAPPSPEERPPPPPSLFLGSRCCTVNSQLFFTVACYAVSYTRGWLTECPMPALLYGMEADIEGMS